jgi:hypothetical protein
MFQFCASGTSKQSGGLGFQVSIAEVEVYDDVNNDNAVPVNKNVARAFRMQYPIADATLVHFPSQVD